MEVVVHAFLSFQTMLKLYHWQTKIYARHIATDTLHTKISANIDRFVEILQGTRGEVVMFNENQIIDLRNFDEKRGFSLVNNFKKWVEIELIKYIHPDETDLINLRDEMIGDLNQTLYLFSLQ